VLDLGILSVIEEQSFLPFRIHKISGLRSLARLDVLDLHGNMVSSLGSYAFFSLCTNNCISTGWIVDNPISVHKNYALKFFVRAPFHATLFLDDLYQITEIEGLQGLQHLRILNMAGNDITCVSGLAHLHSLEEINLRRNRVTNVVRKRMASDLGTEGGRGGGEGLL